MDVYLARASRRSALFAVLTLLVVLLVSPAALGAVLQQAQVLTASDGGPNQEFGDTVAVHGDIAVVGAPGKDTVYVYARSAGAWTEVQKLTPDDAVPGWFGYSVALTDTTIVVGAPLQTRSAHTYAGAAYVFVLSGSTWVQQGAALTVADAAYDQFGWAVAISGDTAIVGAPHATSSGVATPGSAWVFTRSGSTWQQQQSLTETSAVARDLFGDSLALDGDTALIGVPGRAVGVGEAAIFTRSGATWSQGAALSPLDGAAYDNFGSAVAMAGGTALIGSPWHAGQAGTVYAFARSGSAWSQQAELTTADAAPGDLLGMSVALCGDTALLGASNSSVSGQQGAGAAYVFARGASGWQQQDELVASDADPGDGLGTAVALSSEWALTGAPGRATFTGAAYAFSLGAQDTTPPSTTASGCDAAWHKAPVPVTFTATDNAGGSGVAYTEYGLDAAAFVQGSAVTVSGNGEHTLAYRSVDKAGNPETTQTTTVRVDAGRPTPLALAKVGVKKGKKATLRYRVDDLTPQATVTIRVYQGARLKKTLRPGECATNAVQTYAWACRLAKGSYTWRVYATDLAGNTQAKPGSQALRVR